MFLSLVRLRGYEELYVRHVLSKVLLFQASPFLLSSFSSPSWNQLLSCLPPFNISKYYIFISFVLIFVQSICWVSFYMHPNLVCWLPTMRAMKSCSSVHAQLFEIYNTAGEISCHETNFQLDIKFTYYCSDPLFFDISHL